VSFFQKRCTTFQTNFDPIELFYNNNEESFGSDDDTFSDNEDN
jgi:hypothetical protein